MNEIESQRSRDIKQLLRARSYFDRALIWTRVKHERALIINYQFSLAIEFSERVWQMEHIFWCEGEQGCSRIPFCLRILKISNSVLKIFEIRFRCSPEGETKLGRGKSFFHSAVISTVILDINRIMEWIRNGQSCSDLFDFHLLFTSQCSNCVSMWKSAFFFADPHASTLTRNSL